MQTITAGNLVVPRSIAFEQLDPVTSVEDEITVTEFNLEQNYPNPFNPSTKIRFIIPSDVKRETSKMSLVVYDVLGNKVVTLFNEEKAAGNYEVDFNAEELTSGIYFYKLTAGSFSITKKMILLK